MLQVQTKASGKNLKKVLALNSKNGHISKTIHTLHCTLPSNWQVLISVTRSLPCPRTRLLFARACGIVDGHQGAACTKLRATDLRCLVGHSPPWDATWPPRRSTASRQPGLGIRESGVQIQPLECLLGRSRTPRLVLPGTATLLCVSVCF